MPDLDALGIGILDTFAELLRQLQNPRKHIALSLLFEELTLLFRAETEVVCHDYPDRFVRRWLQLRVIAAAHDVVALDKLGGDRSDLEALEKGNETKVDPGRCPKDDGLAGCRNGVFQLVRPDIFNRLYSQHFIIVPS